MKNNRIRLTESQLHNIIRKCVNEAVNELDWKTYANAAKKQAERDNEKYDNDSSLNEPTKHLLKRFGKVGDRREAFQFAAIDRFREQFPGDYSIYSPGLYGIEKGNYGTNPHLKDYYGEEPHVYYKKSRGGKSYDAYGDEALDIAYKYSPSGRKKFVDASTELKNYHGGNYEYIDGQGWQLKK